jgi:hypothetical protein
MDINTLESTLISMLLFYGAPLLAHINSRIGKGLNNGVDEVFSKLTQLLPWRKSKPKTQQEAQAEIEKKLQDNPQLQPQIDTLLKKLESIQPQLTGIVREYHNEQLLRVQHIDNRGAKVKTQINAEKIYNLTIKSD